jgi:hypothetical protein
MRGIIIPWRGPGVRRTAVLVLALLAPLITELFLKGDDLEGLTTGQTRVLFPIVVLLGVSGIVVGILNSYEEFAVPALMPVLWNAAIIVSLVVFVPRFESVETQLYAYAGGVLAGTVLLVVTPVRWLRGRDGRIRAVLDLRDVLVQQPDDAVLREWPDQTVYLEISGSDRVNACQRSIGLQPISVSLGYVPSGCLEDVGRLRSHRRTLHTCSGGLSFRRGASLLVHEGAANL